MVSIPHRYGKNRIVSEKDFTKYEVSIPHRYGKNPPSTLGTLSR